MTALREKLCLCSQCVGELHGTLIDLELESAGEGIIARNDNGESSETGDDFPCIIGVMSLRTRPGH